jgi:rhodanese-related sulfurtransferase
MSIQFKLIMAESISKDQLKQEQGSFVIIDVREPDEVTNGAIENSQNMPLGLVIRNAKKGQIEDLKDKKICVYCASGYRGNIAADELVKAGFSAVNLEGGYMAWTQ